MFDQICNLAHTPAKQTLTKLFSAKKQAKARQPKSGNGPCYSANSVSVRMHGLQKIKKLWLRPGQFGSPRWPSRPACRSNPRAIYTTWAPSWLSRRGAVRLMDVSRETNQYLFGSGDSDRRAGDAPRRSRLRAVHICVENGALASARCSFSLLARSSAPSWVGKIELSPAHGAHIEK